MKSPYDCKRNNTLFKKLNKNENTYKTDEHFYFSTFSQHSFLDL